MYFKSFFGKEAAAMINSKLQKRIQLNFIWLQIKIKGKLASAYVFDKKHMYDFFTFKIPTILLLNKASFKPKILDLTMWINRCLSTTYVDTIVYTIWPHNACDVRILLRATSFCST